MGQNYKKEFLRLFYYVVILIIIFSCVVLFILNNKKEITSNYDSINFKLITSTHTNIPWDFKAVNSSIEIKIGEVTNIKYIVKNLSDKKFKLLYHLPEIFICGKRIVQTNNKNCVF